MDLFKVNGICLPTPDRDVTMQWEDLDAPESGRDESGYMHRTLLRSKIRSWHFTYSVLTQDEFAALQSILNGPKTFTFTFPDPADPKKTLSVQAYLNQYGISWYNAKIGLYRNLKFRIVEC